MKKKYQFICIITMTLALESCTPGKPTTVLYEGKDLSGEATIIRDKNTKQASLDIKSSEKWILYAGKTVKTINRSKPLLKGDKDGIYTIPVTNNERSYFQLVTESGKFILSERHLPMTGGYNFRDLGGFKTKDGKFVKWGKVFRTDDLNKLTEADLNYLSGIPITTIVDFRSEEERIAAPDQNPASVKHNYPLSIVPGDLLNLVKKDTSKMDMPLLMKKINQMLVTDSSCIKAYSTFFDLLQKKEETPLLFHCSAGKDRTGFGAALFLYALGVDEETIYSDYLMSNVYLDDKYAPLVEQNPSTKDLYLVKKEYLQAAISEIKSKYGSIENYLEKELNVDLNLMKEKYLY